MPLRSETPDVPVYADPEDGVAIMPAALQAWTAEVLGRCETPPDIAADVAEILVASDRRGIASHGTAPVIHDAPGRVLVPGEPEVRAEERAADRGIVVDRAHAVGLHGLGVRFGVAFPADVPGMG